MINKARVVLFKAQNKDNKHLLNFKEASKSFLSTKTDEELTTTFKHFCDEHPLYKCRFYVSVNTRDDEKVRKAMMHYLLDNKPPLSKLQQLVVSVADKPENRASNKWLLDMDEQLSEKQRIKFLLDVGEKTEVEKANVTPDGVQVVVSHGFDTRELCKAYPNLEVKHDALFLVDTNF